MNYKRKPRKPFVSICARADHRTTIIVEFSRKHKPAARFSIRIDGDDLVFRETASKEIGRSFYKHSDARFRIEFPVEWVLPGYSGGSIRAVPIKKMKGERGPEVKSDGTPRQFFRADGAYRAICDVIESKRRHESETPELPLNPPATEPPASAAPAPNTGELPPDLERARSLIFELNSIIANASGIRLDIYDNRIHATVLIA